MFFLFKCFVCIALVIVALQWSGDGPSRPSHPHGRAPLAHRPAQPQLGEAAHGLVQAGADALLAAARDKCLAAPRDCAAAIQRLNAAEHERR